MVTQGLSVRNPVIVYNGVFIMEPDTGRVVSSEGFSAGERAFVREKLTASGISPFVFQQELYRPEWWSEIMPGKASKYNGILKLKDILGCDRIVSFGDAVNDIPMFRISDECYAVGNAVPELKAVATGIIGDNESDSVALWFRNHAGR